MSQSASRYAVRRTPEPFDCFDRWEVVELNAWKYSDDPHRRVSSHLSKRKALKHLRRLAANQDHPGTVTAAQTPLADLRTTQ